LLAGLLLGAVAGCGLPPKPLRFNNLMARSVKRLASDAKAFYKSIEPLSPEQGSKNVEASDVRSKYQKLANSVKEIQADWAKMKTPASSTIGPDMRTKFLAFLDGQKSIVDNRIVPIVSIVEDNKTYPDPPSKWNAIKPHLDQIAAEEAKTRDPLIKAQKDYAKEQKLKLAR
jgi:hypothetical protein